MWKTIERTAHRLGFTRNEAVVILFLATVVLIGQAIGMLSEDRTRQPDFAEQYRQHDQTFAARSGSLPERNRETLSVDRNNPGAQPATEGRQSAGEPHRRQSNDLIAGADETANSSQLAPVLNINTATTSALEALPGIGPVTAKRIVDYREQEGLFSMVEDIMKVKSIGPKKFEKLRQFICTE